MKQKLLNSFKLRVCLLVAVLCAGFTSAWGEDTEVVFDFTDSNNYSINTTTKTITYGETTFSYSVTGTDNCQKQAGIQWGASKVDAGTISITTSAFSSYVIKEVKVQATSTAGYNAAVSVGSTSYTAAAGNSAFSSTSHTNTYTGNSSGNLDITLSQSSTKKNVIVQKITITYSTSGGGGSNLTTSDLAITNASTDLTFDLYNNATAQVINYTTSSTGAINITPASPTSYFRYVHDAQNKTITVTPIAVTPSAQTITISQAADETYDAGEASFTVSVSNSDPSAPQAQNVTFKASEDTGSSPLTKSNVTFTCTNGVLNNGSEYRLYASSTTTFSVPTGYLIKRIEFTGVSGNPISNFASTTGLTTSGDNGVWVGSAKSVSFKASSQVRATQIALTIEEEEINTIDVATALTTADNTEVYVQGKVSRVGSFSSNSITYFISDNGTETNELEIYKGKGLEGANFTSVDDIQVGDIVVVHGTLTTYNSVKELAQGSTLVSHSTKAEPELAYETTEYTVAPNASFTTPTLTNPHSLTVAYSISQNDGVASINASTGAVTIGANEGTVTVTASFAGNDTYRAGSASYTINVSDPTKGTQANPYTVAEVIAMAPSSTSEAVKSGVYVKGYIVGGFNSSSTFTTDASSFQESNLALADSYNENSSANVIPVQLGNNTEPRTNFNPKDKPYNVNVAQVVVKADVMKYFNVPGLKNTDEITKVAEHVTVTSVGFATYYTDCALDFDGTGIEAYVGELDGTTLTFRPRTQVPANTGMLLVAAGGNSANVPVAESATAVSNSCMEGTLAGKTLEEDDYILNVVGGAAGFYLADTYTSLAAHRAYIPAQTGNHVKSFAINLDDTDGINSMSNGQLTMDNAVIFNLAGQRLSKPVKGINIINGRKVLVK